MTFVSTGVVGGDNHDARVVAGTAVGTLAGAIWGGGLSRARGMLPLWVSLAVLGALGNQVAGQRGRPVGGVADYCAALPLTRDQRPPVNRSSRPYRRRALAATTWVLDRARPLAPPAVWHMLLAARSAAGSGPVLTVPAPNRALVLAPHPDDETIGCGGTVALMTAAGTDVSVVIATSGEYSVAEPGTAGPEAARRREEEAASACRILGAGEPVFLRLADGDLLSQVDTLATRIAEQLAGREPDLVFVPWPLDDHPDHRALAMALGRALGEDGIPAGCQVWGYEVWAPLPANRLVDVSAVWGSKVDALDRHRLGRETFDLNAHLALSRWRSIFALQGTGHAEAFLALPGEEFRKLAAGTHP